MKVDFLKRRAEKFLKNGIKLLGQGEYEISSFNFEQAAQLLLKHYLFVKLKDFPKTHSLTQLLKDVGRVYQKEKEVKKLINENLNQIADLGEAYITSRYLPVEFFPRQVEDMGRFVQKLQKFLKNL